MSDMTNAELGRQDNAHGTILGHVSASAQWHAALAMVRAVHLDNTAVYSGSAAQPQWQI